MDRALKEADFTVAFPALTETLLYQTAGTLILHWTCAEIPPAAEP